MNLDFKEHNLLFYTHFEKFLSGPGKFLKNCAFNIFLSDYLTMPCHFYVFGFNLISSKILMQLWVTQWMKWNLET